MSTQKLAAFLAHAGVASRRQSEKLILDGKVKVNGEVQKNVATRVDPEKDKIAFGGQELNLIQNTILLAMYKPAGYVSTASDPDGKKTILHLLPEKYKKMRLYPAGRLDEDSEGLVLLTNDGDLAYHLTHPKFQMPRTYEVIIDGRLTSIEEHRLKTGVPLKDGRTGAAELEFLDENERGQLWKITIREGRHHQVRRMFWGVNHDVVKLKRVTHGKYELGDLSPGEIREEKI